MKSRDDKHSWLTIAWFRLIVNCHDKTYYWKEMQAPWTKKLMHEHHLRILLSGCKPYVGTKDVVASKYANYTAAGTPSKRNLVLQLQRHFSTVESGLSN